MLQKRVLTIQDISCVGRCSLTVALPIISSAGIETCVLPTAVLSTHSGGFKGYTYRDLTNDISGITSHWKSLDLTFDAIYTGYLGSIEQVHQISNIIDTFSRNNTITVVDPVMADNGKLYSGFTDEFPKEMERLCRKADVILPNLTEAALLLGEGYHESYDEYDIKNTLMNLSSLGCKNIVLTGIMIESGKIGAAAYDGHEITYHLSERIDGHFHGTGDIFASAFTATLLSKYSIREAATAAVNFTAACIQATVNEDRDRRYGVNFEVCLPLLMKKQNSPEKIQ